MPRIPPSRRRGASVVIKKAIRSNPVGSSLTRFPFKSALRARSVTESAMPSASNGLLLNFSVASCAFKVRGAPLGWTTRSPIFTSFSLLINASPTSGLCPLRTADPRTRAARGGQVGDRLLTHCRRQIFAGCQDRRRRADCTYRRHVNVLGGQCDEG